MTSILDKSFTYHNATSHTGSVPGQPSFEERMREYAKTPATSKWDKPQHLGAGAVTVSGDPPTLPLPPARQAYA